MKEWLCIRWFIVPPIHETAFSKSGLSGGDSCFPGNQGWHGKTVVIHTIDCQLVTFSVTQPRPGHYEGLFRLGKPLAMAIEDDPDWLIEAGSRTLKKTSPPLWDLAEQHPPVSAS